MSLMKAFVTVARRAGVPVWIPTDVDGTCCGVPFSSKGYEQGHHLMVNRAMERFWEWSDQGRLPVVIDTSQLLAEDVDVPLIVPEVNAGDLGGYTDRLVVVSPDSPAVALAVALKPLHDAASVTRVVCSTFEPVAHAGRAGIEELQRQTVELMNGRSVENEVFPHRIAFNLLPQVGDLLAGGAARGERQVAAALRRLLGDHSLPVSITRICVPMFYGGALSVNVETAAKLTAAQAREILRVAPGIVLQDEPGSLQYPTPAEAVAQDATLVGRIREEESLNLLDLWIAIDNIRKGAAVNAVQIAELLIRDYL
jgi:aspartate-semialdehyde dehydrogenase